MTHHYCYSQSYQYHITPQICSENDENIDSVYSTTTQESISWAYNLTNPLAYLEGGEAHFEELGGYSYDLAVTRTHPVFSEGGTKVQYTLYVSGEFNAAQSASGLAADDEIYSVNVAYQTILGRAKSEAVVMLSSSCLPTQLVLMSNPSAPVCRTEQINDPLFPQCRCCSPSPLENSTTCSDLASPTSTAGGLISYLAMLDGGIKLDSVPSAFPLSSGAHSPLVVKKTVNALLLGTPSAIMGMFQYTGGEDIDRSRIANTTADFVEACTALAYCPSLPELMMQIAQAANMNVVMGIIKNVDCTGVIPNTAGLMAVNISEARALEMRYLEGANCRPYTATLAVAGLLSATAGMGSTHTCANAGESLPCCPSAFSIPGMSSGMGLGCLMWVPGGQFRSLLILLCVSPHCVL